MSTARSAPVASVLSKSRDAYAQDSASLKAEIVSVFKHVHCRFGMKFLVLSLRKAYIF